MPARLRTIAGDLSPRGLEQQGLICALEQLAETLSQTTDTTIVMDAPHEAPLALESQLAVYRLVQDVLAELIARGERDVRIEVKTSTHDVRTSIWSGHSPGHTAAVRISRRHQEWHRLLGGHLRIGPRGRGPLLEAVMPALPVAPVDATRPTANR